MRGSDVDLPVGVRGPACVTGMHGSGGPMVAQLLYRLGLDLGDAPLVAGPADPATPWSNEAFVRVNEGILRAQGGDWDVPPAPGWDEGLGSLRQEAEWLIGGFRGREPWGWEDPRSSLTLPFWLDLLPEMKVVVCVRNPLEAADALREQGVTSHAFGLNLWKAYNERLLETLPEGRYVVTHHDAYLYRPQAEIRRVLDFLGMTASDQLIAHARSTSLKGLRHHSVATDELRDLKVAPPEMYELYTRMCREADFDPDAPAPVSGSLLARERAVEAG
jgi:hypothetical protein